MAAMMMELYSYFRSSAAYRVRIALNLKQLPYQYKAIHLVRSGGEQHGADYIKLNPLGLVPTLIDGNNVLTQSLAIIEYLDEAYPDICRLLPVEIEQRAQARSLAQLVACDIHPLNNLRVLKYLSNELSANKERLNTWYAHWIKIGFDAFEQVLKRTAGEFCLADEPTIADCCLVPQVFNAHRFQVDLSPYKNIRKIFHTCQTLSAFKEASPENQPDAA